MGCKGCGGTPRMATTVCRVFSCPLDGVDIEIIVRGEVTEANAPLVKQYLGFVYDVLVPIHGKGIHGGE